MIDSYIWYKKFLYPHSYIVQLYEQKMKSIDEYRIPYFCVVIDSFVLNSCVVINSFIYIIYSILYIPILYILFLGFVKGFAYLKICDF